MGRAHRQTTSASTIAVRTTSPNRERASVFCGRSQNASPASIEATRRNPEARLLCLPCVGPTSVAHKPKSKICQSKAARSGSPKACPGECGWGGHWGGQVLTG